MAAMTLFHTEKCRHLVSPQTAYDQCLCSIDCSVRQFLIYSTLVVVLQGDVTFLFRSVIWAVWFCHCRWRAGEKITGNIQLYWSHHAV